MQSQAPPRESEILTETEEIVRRTLPPGWTMQVEREPSIGNGRRADALISLCSPTGASAEFMVEVKRAATGRQIRDALARLDAAAAARTDALPLFVAPWLGPGARERLIARGVSYVDTTGNVRIVASSPGLFVAREGATRDPWPIDKSLQSLRGRGAMRAVRALVDFSPPYGVRELARRTQTSAATLSRVIDLLTRDALAERGARGLVTGLDWAGAIRRWARDYDVVRTNGATAWLAPRGVDALIDSLRSTDTRYALTGSIAARKYASVAPARLVMVYVDDVSRAADDFALRRADVGANAMLLQPHDRVVFERCVIDDGVTRVSPSQLAVDLLTGPGRLPSEGEELLSWMGENVDAWRA